MRILKHAERGIGCAKIVDCKLKAFVLEQLNLIEQIFSIMIYSGFIKLKLNQTGWCMIFSHSLNDLFHEIVFIDIQKIQINGKRDRHGLAGGPFVDQLAGLAQHI